MKFITPNEYNYELNKLLFIINTSNEKGKRKKWNNHE